MTQYSSNLVAVTVLQTGSLNSKSNFDTMFILLFTWDKESALQVSKRPFWDKAWQKKVSI